MSITKNPARVDLLTAMAQGDDDGTKVWFEQPKGRDLTKLALVRDGYATAEGKITPQGRGALAALKLDAVSPMPKAGEPAKVDRAKAKAAEDFALGQKVSETTKAELELNAQAAETAKAKFEAARAEVVKPAKAAKPTKAALTASLQSEEFAKAVAALPAPTEADKEAAKARARANRAGTPAKGRDILPAQPAKIPAEVKSEPVAEAPEAPEEQAKPSLGRGYLLAAILRDIYGVGLADAPALAVIWAACQLADMEGVEVAKAELSEVNKFREQAGKVPAYPPYGSKLF